MPANKPATRANFEWALVNLQTNVWMWGFTEPTKLQPRANSFYRFIVLEFLSWSI
jgi:hypothetical protein